MKTVITICSNKLSSEAILIKDIGMYAPAGGEELLVDDERDISLVRNSKDIQELSSDSKYGKRSHSLTVRMNGKKVKLKSIKNALSAGRSRFERFVYLSIFIQLIIDCLMILQLT